MIRATRRFWRVRVDGPLDRGVQTFRRLATLAHEVPRSTPVIVKLTTLPDICEAMQAPGASIPPFPRMAVCCLAIACFLLCGVPPCLLVLHVSGPSPCLSCFVGSSHPLGRHWGTTVMRNRLPPFLLRIAYRTANDFVHTTPLQKHPERMLSKSVLDGHEKSPLQTFMDVIARLLFRPHLICDFALPLSFRFLRVPGLLEPPNFLVKFTGFHAASVIQRYMVALHQLVYAVFHFQGYLTDTGEVATMVIRFVPPIDHDQILPYFLRTPHVELNFVAGGNFVSGTLCGKP